MDDLKNLFSDFILINDGQTKVIEGGVDQQKKWKDCNIFGDVHSCVSYEVVCKNNFTYKSGCMALDLESVKCPSDFSMKRV